MRSRIRIILALVVAAIVAAYNLFQHEQQTNLAVAHAPALTPVPAHAKAFTLGELEFKACELNQKQSGATTAAYCAPFEVPEDWDAPDGRKIALKLALIKSDAEAADTDFVVFLAGGPGQSAIETYPQIASALAPLRKHHHILLLDQRGTGASNPLLCTHEKDTREEADVDLENVRRLTRECLAQVQKQADPRDYTTTMAARDLESVRRTLGAPSFDLVGVSYGTRMAQQYLMRYPDGVRSVVLDSVVPNELALGEEFAVNLDAALKLQFDHCIQTPVCAKAFGDPFENLLKLRNLLHATPQEVHYPDPLTFAPQTMHLDAFALAGLVRMFAYTPESAALLPLSIAEAGKGNYIPLVGQVKLLSDDLADLHGNGMQQSVICSEDADLLTARPQDADTMLGTTLIDVLQAQCAIWPHGTRPADFHTPLKSEKPILVLEGELDPVTPPRYGDAVIKNLGNARLLIAKGQGHNVIGRGCIPKLVNEFVEKLDPQKLDASCIDVLGPIPAFIDFNGAAP